MMPMGQLPCNPLLMLRKAKVFALNQLLLLRFGGKVGRGLAAELSRRHAYSNRLNEA
jgi:hypothetical protein